MINGKNIDIEWLRERGYILLEYMTGSQMYGTSIPTSDKDFKGIYVLPDSMYADLNFNKEDEEVKFKKKDETGVDCEYTFYELRNYMRLLEKSNPNIMEVFDIPQDCLVYMHPSIKLILDSAPRLITKNCANTFAGYAKEQISKAKGQDKKQNWESEKFERKTILDFCYVPFNQGSMPVRSWMKIAGQKEESLGLVRIPHMPNTFGLYILKDNPSAKGLANDVAILLSEVPVDVRPDAIMSFNESAWSKHCDDYKSYQTWVANRNDARWVDVQTHGQKIDGKNMLHMQRLINMAIDIANGKGVITRRPEAEELVKIRRGEVALQELLDMADGKIKDMQKLFADAELPKNITHKIIRDLYKAIRWNARDVFDIYKNSSPHK